MVLLEKGKALGQLDSNAVGQVRDDVGLHQLAEELLLLGYVVCPGLWGCKGTQSETRRLSDECRSGSTTLFSSA